MTTPAFVDRPLIYIAGPYSTPDPVLNTHQTIAFAGELMQSVPVTAFVPHLTLLWHLVEPHDIEWWYAYDLAVLDRCDGLYRLPGMSTGAAREVAYARAHGIPTFDVVAELAAWVEAGCPADESTCPDRPERMNDALIDFADRYREER